MNNHTHILFDLYNTLFKFHPDREITQHQACKSIGLEIDRNLLKLSINKADKWFASQTAKNSVHIMNENQKTEFFIQYEKIIAKNMNLNISHQQATKMWEFVFNAKSSLKIYDDVEESLKYLKNNRYTLGIITNIDEPGKELLKKLKLEKYISYIITSMDAGASKPDPKIFTYTLNLFDVVPGKCMFIGDQIDTDVRGALDSGLTPVLLDRENQYIDYKKCLKISNLQELRKYLITN
mgnify:CR=1 FL=1